MDNYINFSIEEKKKKYSLLTIIFHLSKNHYSHLFQIMIKYSHRNEEFL